MQESKKDPLFEWFVPQQTPSKFLLKIDHLYPTMSKSLTQLVLPYEAVNVYRTGTFIFFELCNIGRLLL